MSIRDDGGPAYPGTETDGHYYPAPGMTLRDWFAGQALAGLIDGASKAISELAKDTDVDAKALTACMAFSLADAMIAEKRRREADDE